MFTTRLLACLAFLALLWPLATTAAPFTPGNLVVVRIGDGSAALSSAATATFLLEYTPTGTLVQTIALPTAVSGSNRILTNTGSSSTDATLSRSEDGRYLVLTGYDAAPGTATVAGTTSATVNRVIGRIAADGTINTSTVVNDAFSAGNIRSAATVDGANFYAVGSNSGVRYVPFGGTGASTAINSAPTNIRVVEIADGNLYVSAASGTYQGISQVGTGLPTTTGQTVTQLPGFPTASGPQPYEFFFADLSTSEPGVDVVYVADDRTSSPGGIQKWSLVGGTWTLNGSIASTLAVRGLDGMVSGGTVTLAASGNGGLFLLTDNAGYNAAPSAAMLPMAIATAGTNAVFRGVAFAPVAGMVTPAPNITSFTPATGNVGATVTITGTNFTGATSVTLNGVAITGFTVVNGTTITFTVPMGATSGAIAVTTPGGTATSSTNFTVTVATPAPTITSFTPASGNVGATVTITGTNLTGATSVTLGGVAAMFTVVNGTTITFTVPTGATTGAISVTTPGGTVNSGTNFTVTTPVPAPTITSFTPASGNVGATVTITGTNFTGATAVTLNGAAISGFTVVNGTTITFTVPTGATSGAIAVTTPGGTATSTTSFTVTTPTPAPTIASFTPASGNVGATVTITGTNFTGATSVTLNGVAITGFTVVNGTTITFTVPMGATSGAIAVTTPGGTATSSTSFTVTVPTPAPTITSFTPTSGASGATVTITGTNLTGATAVTLNGVAITGFTVVNATTITFTVPASAASGTIAVTTPGGTATSTGTFTVTPAVPAPTITSFSPARAVAGMGFTLTVNGTNLVAGTVINFNGNNYTGMVLGSSGTGYSVVIPASGVPAPGTYPITATNGGGTSMALSFIVVAPSTVSAFEDFETGTKGGYATGTVMLSSGAWTFTDALLGNLFNDKTNGVQSARIRGGGSITMNFDKPNGAGVITLQAALYGTDAAASFTLEISSDGGNTWTTLSGAPAALTTTLTTYSFTANRPGNVRLRISSTNTTAGSNPRINIDDITITNFMGTGTREASQAQLSLYPNPTADLVTVGVNGNAAGLSVEVRDLLGRAVLSTTLPASGQLSLRTLPAGTYLLTVDGKLTRRITKE
ncbi:hypothetical protein GCM10023185_14450 [Hymenobacter saemangeumensis]|uniref:IPT/TIG domain-containing protein n=2 Tax=Hymenobacter saemangeumensis TaxID=1084522 RepID=A0ABP8I8S6_9BACT